MTHSRSWFVCRVKSLHPLEGKVLIIHCFLYLFLLLIINEIQAFYSPTVYLLSSTEFFLKNRSFLLIIKFRPLSALHDSVYSFSIPHPRRCHRTSRISKNHEVLQILQLSLPTPR